MEDTTSMKPEIHTRVYRLQDGEVAAGIVDGDGTLLDIKYFGKFTEAQYESLKRVIDKHALKYGRGQSDSAPEYKGCRETS